MIACFSSTATKLRATEAMMRRRGIASVGRKEASRWRSEAAAWWMNASLRRSKAAAGRQETALGCSIIS